MYNLVKRPSSTIAWLWKKLSFRVQWTHWYYVSSWKDKVLKYKEVINVLIQKKKKKCFNPVIYFYISLYRKNLLLNTLINYYVNRNYYLVICILLKFHVTFILINIYLLFWTTTANFDVMEWTLDPSQKMKVLFPAGPPMTLWLWTLSFSFLSLKWDHPCQANFTRLFWGTPLQPHKCDRVTLLFTNFIGSLYTTL